MKEPSELEQFLRSRSSEGRVESRGGFTISRQEALKKLAEFTLPFAGAWAVKVLQGLVATRSEHPIRVNLLATEIHFFFSAPDFSLDEFEERFTTPAPPKKRSLSHLLAGVWNVALRDNWGFQLALADCATTLIWDGQELHRVESSRPRDCACLALTPMQERKNLSWVSGLAGSGKRNSELLLTMAQNCYLCPVPLTVDGRRLDSLQGSPTHGWSERTFPFTVAFVEAQLPRLRIPPGTFSGTPSLPTTSKLHDGGGWKQIGEARMNELAPRRDSPMPFILCANVAKVSRVGAGLWSEADVEAEGLSTISWVSDGVVVQQERLFEQACHISVGCFVSAGGLPTDLTTLQLLDSPEKERRLADAKFHLRTALKQLEGESYEEIVKSGTLAPRVVGGAMVAAGVGLMLVVPSVGAVLALAGGKQWRSATLGGEARAKRVRLGLEQLVSNLTRPTTGSP